MKLMVGLGNPGAQYRDTRHNLGWDALAAIVHHYQLSPGVSRFQGRFGDGRVGEVRVAWLCPETYMNLSGQSVAAAVRFFKLEPPQVVVFHDDLDLAPGRVRMKRGGGNGGHNGLKSIQQNLGSAAFVRIRLGIGRPPPGFDTARFVLSPPPGTERDRISPVLEALPGVLPRILADDLGGALNQLLNPPTKTKPSPG